MIDELHVMKEALQSNPQQSRLAIGTWNVTSLVGKEHVLVHEVERYQLDIVRFSLTHGLGSETSFLDRGWTLFQTGLGLCGYIGMLLGVSPLMVTPLCYWETSTLTRATTARCGVV